MLGETGAAAHLAVGGVLKLVGLHGAAGLRRHPGEIKSAALGSGALKRPKRAMVSCLVWSR